MNTDNKKPTGSANYSAGHTDPAMVKPDGPGAAMTPSPEKLQALEAIRARYPGVSSAVQRQRIRAALALFPLTTFEAIRYLDCYDPRPRVLELRQAGEAIETHWQTIQTEAGERHRVGLYVLRSGAAKGGAA